MGWKPMTRSSLAGLVEDAVIEFDWLAVIDRCYSHRGLSELRHPRVMGFQPMNDATTTLHPFADQSRNPSR